MDRVTFNYLFVVDNNGRIFEWLIFFPPPFCLNSLLFYESLSRSPCNGIGSVEVVEGIQERGKGRRFF